MNLDINIVESSSHYNDLSAREKFEVCKFLDYEMHFIKPALFSDGFKRNFENAKKNKIRNAYIYPFGLIPEIADNLDFRNLTGKNLQFICADLYKMENVRLAKYTADILGLITEDERRGFVKENRELVKDYNELLLDFKKLENKKVETETRNAMIVNKLMLKGNITLEEFKEIRAEIEKKDISYILPNKDILDNGLSSN